MITQNMEFMETTDQDRKPV